MIRSKKMFYVLIFCIIFSLVLFGCNSNSKSSGEADNKQQEENKFPEKPINIMITYSAGAATDTSTRPMSRYSPDKLGVPLVITNIAGAGGSTGWNQWASQPKDGYHLTAYCLPHIISKSMLEDVKYNWEEFVPIVHWEFNPAVLTVHKDSPFQTVEEVIEYAKENPGKLTGGTAGLYTGHHLTLLLLQQAAGIELTNIPFDGAADAQAAIMGNQIDLNFANLSDMYRLGDAVRILAVATEKRQDLIPDVPTFKEKGYDVVMSTDRGLAVQKGTPQEAIDALEKGFLDIVKSDEFQGDMERLGIPQGIMNSEEATKHIENYARAIEKLLTDIGELKK